MTTQATHTPPRRTSAADLAHDPHQHVRLDFAVAERDDRLAEIEREKVLRDPGFGKTFTDHMVKADLDAGRGLARRGGHRVRARCSSTPPRPSCTTRRRSSRA